MAHPATPKWSALPPFATLDDCLAHIQQAHGQKLIQHVAKDLDTGKPTEVEMPSFLYRGEVGWFDACVSRMERVRLGHFPGVTRKQLNRIRQDTDRELQSRLCLHPMLSAGLMQHYGFPTEFMDATSSTKTAAYFSRLGAATAMTEGSVAVFDMSVLSKNAIVVDLNDHAAAVRPRHQEAYGVFSRTHRNLKDPEAMSDMGITWYTFLGDSQTTARVLAGVGLLSVGDDETAGILRLWLDGSIKKHGKLTQPAAEYLANRIAHCPMVAKVLKWRWPWQPKIVQLVTAKLAGIVINEPWEITRSTQLWSRQFPNVTTR
jgi:FRG domain